MTNDADATRLLDWFSPFASCTVAFSGGVDSAVVAAAAFRALGSSAQAITGLSASLPQGQLEQARRVAAEIGIAHRLLPTREFEQPQYLRNDGDRCYHCKSELYAQLERLLESRSPGDLGVTVNGANLDDLSDYRPGLRAAGQHAVRSPLAETCLRKQDVRRLARFWELSVWDAPASPCLSSRVAYGQEVTPQRLAMIDQAERRLRELGFPEVRVRYHGDDLARIEVPLDQIARFARPEVYARIAEDLRGLGFRFVTLDLEGLRSGSLNQLLRLELPPQ